MLLDALFCRAVDRLPNLAVLAQMIPATPGGVRVAALLAEESLASKVLLLGGRKGQSDEANHFFL
jgi:hypothetical protein